MDDATFAGVIAALNESGERVEGGVASVPEERWDDVIHSGDGAWSRRQLLAHIAANDLRQLVRVRIGAGIAEPGDEAEHTAELNVQVWNQAQVDRRAGLGVG